ncbi:hypothetical protein ACQP1G_16455 [Nocardia sp. CA-107356]|uniref:hypothetical protein n=1 Tax=Nocardia sp. CA-107356 TaxID=3239972 RepID=UPI003D93A8BB
MTFTSGCCATESRSSDQEPIVPEYCVRWEIDVSAEDPVSVAFAAFDLYRAPESTTTVFDVTEPDGHTYCVDLDDDPITPHQISTLPRPRSLARRLLRMLPARARRRAAWFTKMSAVLQQPA